MKERRHTLLGRLRGQAALQAMALPGILWMLVFCYLPLWFLVVAFKQYSIVKPISAVPGWG